VGVFYSLDTPRCTPVQRRRGWGGRARLLQARMARGIHRLPKVSLGPAMPYPSTPFGRATPKTALQPFLGWPACRAGGLRPSSTPLDTPRRTGLVGAQTERPIIWDMFWQTRTGEAEVRKGEEELMRHNGLKCYILGQNFRGVVYNVLDGHLHDVYCLLRCS
jgi:hypothetical protein